MRMHRRVVPLVVLAAFVGFAGWLAAQMLAAEPAGGAPASATEEKLLRDRKIGTDGPALLAFFRKRTLTEADRERISGLIRKLGDDAFDVRETAEADLQALGWVAFPLLRKAVRDPDPEVVRRVDECLQALEEKRERSLFLPAARLLAQRNPAGASQVLLNYLPSAPDERISDAVQTALEQVSFQEGQPDPVLVEAITDKEPLRRAAAARLLARHSPPHRALVRRLLLDSNTQVRFEAAATLTQMGDRQAIEPLLRLLQDSSPEQAWQVEDLLFRLAGDQAVQVSLSSGLGVENRQRCLDAWRKWWQTNKDRIDLSRLAQDERSLGEKVVCQMQGGAEGSGRVFAYGPDDQVRWQFDNVSGPIDVQLQPNGRLLLAEINVNRVTERDRSGKIYFQKHVDNAPMSCQRLSNGNVFIATYTELLEVAPDGTTVSSFKRTDNQRIFCAQKLRNGHVLFVNSGSLVIELDGEGKEVRSVPAGDTSNWGSVELLPNGHYLVCRCGRHEVVEIDAAGKVHWSCHTEWPTWASQRSNGRVLVACAHSGQLIEFDRDGKEVWKQKLSGRPCRVRRY